MKNLRCSLMLILLLVLCGCHASKDEEREKAWVTIPFAKHSTPECQGDDGKMIISVADPGNSEKRIQQEIYNTSVSLDAEHINVIKSCKCGGCQVIIGRQVINERHAIDIVPDNIYHSSDSYEVMCKKCDEARKYRSKHPKYEPNKCRCCEE